MPKITEIFAFVCEDNGPEDEGITGVNIDGLWMPLIGADMSRVESLRPFAAKVAKQSGKRIRILKFTGREEIGFIEP